MAREIKDFKFTIGDVSDAGKFIGHASVFNGVDSYNDTVLPGAFKKTLKENKSFPLLWSHDPYHPLGVMVGDEDKKGLAIEGDLNMEVESAREKRALMKQGAIRGLSIGYEAVKWDIDPVSQVRYLREIKLWEVSPCVFPADKNARIANIKNIPYTDFGGLMDLLNELDIKEIDERFQEAAKRAADRIYALLKDQEPLPSTPDAEEPLGVKETDYTPLFTALDKLNNTLTGGK